MRVLVVCNAGMSSSILVKKNEGLCRFSGRRTDDQGSQQCGGRE